MCCIITDDIVAFYKLAMVVGNGTGVVSGRYCANVQTAEPDGRAGLSPIGTIGLSDDPG